MWMVILKWVLIVGGIIVVLIVCAGFAICAWLGGDVENDEYYRDWDDFDDPDEPSGPVGGLNSRREIEMLVCLRRWLQ